MSSHRSWRAAAIFAALAVSPCAAQGRADLIEKVCSGETLPDGKEAGPLPMGDRFVDLKPDHPEYLRMAPLLPAPPAGWTTEADKVTVFASHLIGCGISVSREMRQSDKRLTVGVMLTPMVAGMRDELANAQLRPPDRVFELKDRRGLESRAGEDMNLSLLAGNALVHVSGPAAAPETRAMLERVDLEAVEAFAR